MDEKENKSSDSLSSGRHLHSSDNSSIRSSMQDRAKGVTSTLSKMVRDGIRFYHYYPEDASEVVKLERQTLRGGDPVGAYSRSDEDDYRFQLYTKLYAILAKPDENGRAAVNNFFGTVCGFGYGVVEEVFVDSESMIVGSVVDLIVHPDFRRKTIASRLFQELEYKMKKADASIIIARIPRRDIPAIVLFEKNGFSSFLDINVHGWGCHRRVQLDESFNYDLVDDIKVATEALQDFDFLPDEHTLEKIVFDETFCGGTVMVTSDDGESSAQVSIFRYYEIFETTVKEEKSIFAKYFCRNNEAANEPQRPCILFAHLHDGVNGLYLLRQAIARAHNECLGMGCTDIYMGVSANELQFSAEDLLPVKDQVRFVARYYGKPIAEAIPELGKHVFIDPRW